MRSRPMCSIVGHVDTERYTHRSSASKTGATEKASKNSEYVCVRMCFLRQQTSNFAVLLPRSLASLFIFLLS